jgi:hypothetical protein
MDENIDGVDERRRDLLKKAGIAAGAVWAAPAVASNFAPAGAQGGSSVCTGITAFDCVNFILNPCGSGGPVGDCYCWELNNGDSVCIANYFCGTVAPCPGGTCPPGFECTVGGCCSDPNPVCAPVCGTGRSRGAGASGLTATGRVVD